jgi:hypothetical protein
MKKTIIFVVLAIVLIASCTAQSTNDAQKIVGTWVSVFSEREQTFVFNANGTGTVTNKDRDGGVETKNIFWGISASGEIFLCANPDGTNGNYSKFSMSPDGRIMSIDRWVYRKK